MKHLLRLLFCLILTLAALALVACGEEPAPSDAPPEEAACTHAETALQNAVPASCGKAGYTGDTVCTDCDEILKRGSAIKALDCEFALTGTVLRAPTCEQEGTAERKCIACGRAGVPAPVEPLGHQPRYTDAAEDAVSGLSTDANHTVTCARAGCDYTATAPHEGDFTVVAEPTCYAPAYKSGTCTLCNVTYRAPMASRPATGGHEWGEPQIVGNYAVRRCLNEGCPFTTQQLITAPGEGPEAPDIDPGDPEPRPADLIDKPAELNIEMTVLTPLKTFTDHNGVLCRIVQGACTDGKYYYVAINDGYSGNADSVSIIRKYDLATGAVVATFENLRIAHANDLCYNPMTNEIIAVHNAPVRQLITILDGDSLEFKRQVTLDLEIYSMAYDIDENCYWVGLSYGYRFAKLDADFKQVGNLYQGVETGYTKQGMDVDGKYIYFLQYNINCIMVYDKQGAYVTRLDLPQTAKEAENICHVGDVFYIGYFDGSGGTLYKTVLNAPKPIEITTPTTVTVLPTHTDSAEALCKMAQGSCSDGTHIYLAMNNDDSTGYRSVIYKINPQTGAILATFEGLELGLSNDLTYNSRTGEILVVHNKSDAKKLTVLDAATMTAKRTVTLAYNVYAIAYDAVQDRYFLGLSGTYDFALTDGDFNKLETYTGHSSGYTKQGMECDGTYLYFVQSGSNNLAVYKTDGTYVGAALLPEGVGSAQSVCCVNGVLYIGYNDVDAGGMLYRTEVTVNLPETN